MNYVPWLNKLILHFIFLGLIMWNGDESKLGLKLNQVLILCEIQQIGLKNAPDVPLKNKNNVGTAMKGSF